jgi:hypothetical protein
MMNNEAVCCSMEGCSETDFLPTKCSKCCKSFCASHSQFSAHRCSRHVEASIPMCPLCSQPVPNPHKLDLDSLISRHIDQGCPAGRGSSLKPCGLSTCTRRELVLVRCERCRGAFCVEHRQNHNCAAQRLQSTPETKFVHSRSPPPAANLQFAPSNTAATPYGKPVSDPADRIVLLVLFTSDCFVSPSAVPRGFYFQCSGQWALGRLLDAVCQQAEVSNTNNAASPVSRLRLFSSIALEASLPLQGPVSGLVDGRSSAPPVLIVSRSEDLLVSKEAAALLSRFGGSHHSRTAQSCAASSASKPVEDKKEECQGA